MREIGEIRDGGAKVNDFFEAVEYADLLLPDGWFGGRPMENHHRLTFVTQLKKRLLIELDDHLLLSFSGDVDVRQVTTEYAMVGGTPTLLIAGFCQCVLDYLEYVNERPHSRSFHEGTVQFVAGQ